MAPETTPPPPGSMTVPLLFGWGEIVTVLVLLIVVAVAYFVVAAAGAASGARSEWEAWLDARSSRRPDAYDLPVEPVAPGRERAGGDPGPTG